MYKTIKFSRVELSRKVWQTPILKLAQEIGISDVGLAKACRRAKVPLPNRGHWAKNERAREPEPPLPEHDGSDCIEFTVFEAPPAPDRPAKEKALEVPVSKDLADPHPLVQATLKDASTAELRDGKYLLHRKTSLDIRVTPAMLDRTARILDALIKASELKGCKWSISSARATTVTVDGQAMKIEVKERVKKHELPRPPVVSERRGRRKWEPNYAALFAPTEYEWISTGELTLSIEEYFDDVVRKRWNDTAHTSLEDKLGDILATLPIAAASREARERRFAEEKCQRELEEQRRVAAARRAEEQKRLRAKLVRAMQSWERAVRMRTFCNAVSSDLKEGSDEQKLALPWLNWARQQADELDPLRSEMNDLFRLKHHVEEWFAGDHSYPGPKLDWWD